MPGRRIYGVGPVFVALATRRSFRTCIDTGSIHGGVAASPCHTPKNESKNASLSSPSVVPLQTRSSDPDTILHMLCNQVQSSACRSGLLAFAPEQAGSVWESSCHSVKNDQQQIPNIVLYRIPRLPKTSFEKWSLRIIRASKRDASTLFKANRHNRGT
jgi:hypothetical protein